MSRDRIVLCSYCDARAKLVTGAVIYPGRNDLANKLFWHCPPCRAWVGCHPPARENGRGGKGAGDVPMGRLANAELRRAKQAAHEALDPLWRSGEMTRQGAYAWLAGALQIPHKQCHVGAFDVDRCRATVAACIARVAATTTPTSTRA